ncbi:MAG: pyridoxal-phosphate dependent enzyme [Prevotellaceae bacterium]|jgi:threonine synthase|nr:pyridoxal-phosphate dependent enzyme [Prevotellaceae bacterium]
MVSKYYFKCVSCGKTIDGFGQWLSLGKKCPECGKERIETFYHDYNSLKSLIYNKECKVNTIWRYFDYLPLANKNNIVSCREGNINTERWEFLEKYAFSLNINCKVWVYRNDENYATGTFKDAGASLAASVLKEHNIENYVVASTGNVANAFAYYMSKARISLYAFVPENALAMNSAGVSYYGQRVFRVLGDYAKTKKVAKEFADKHNFLMTGGNTDPLRVEAKRTMVFDWLRNMPEFPTVYLQSLSGGTGPIAIEKAIRETENIGLPCKLPRFLMIQPDGCAPMAHAWENAKTRSFPDSWQNDYPVYDNPETKIPTLATGNPATYPVIGELTHRSGGEIFSFEESKCEDVVRAVAFETLVGIGPASAVVLGGFFKALKRGLIKNGDVVMINIGEGLNRAPEFLESLTYTEQRVACPDECELIDRKKLQRDLWNKINLL